MLQLIQSGALFIGTLAGAITDAKTGYIYDWITYPMIILGVILSIMQQQWMNLIAGAGIFVVLYITYKLGKLGGGDVKILAGIALLNPFNDYIFLITLLFFAAMSAMIFYSAYYGVKYARKGINFKENKQGIQKAILFGAILAAYFAALISMGMIIAASAAIILIPLLFGLVFVALQKGITKNFFEKKILLKQLEEDEVLAEERNNEKVQKLLRGKNLIGEKEKRILAKAGIKSIYVLRGLPPFAPFIFVGAVIALMQPSFLVFLFI